jgi:hypothetical protein
MAGKNPIAAGNFHGFLLVTVKVLNSYVGSLFMPAKKYLVQQKNFSR